MRPLSLNTILMAAGLAAAQGDLVSLLQSQSDLTILTELVGLIPGLVGNLSASSDITIFAPTDQAFVELDKSVPEGIAFKNRNVTTLAALLANHVVQGYHPSYAIGEVPSFLQTRLLPKYYNDVQPFTNDTGGQYIGMVQNMGDLNVISGELNVSRVTKGDIHLGESIVIHKIDNVLAFGPPLQLFTARDPDLSVWSYALEAAMLDIGLGLQGAGQTARNVSDLTFFVPNNAAFEQIGSVISDADPATLRDVIRTHFIEDSILFSPSLSNTTVVSSQGAELTVTVFPDGTIYVNNAKVIFPNIILYNGVAHVIDVVLNPNAPPPNPEMLQVCAPERKEFPSASPVSSLPFTAATFASDPTVYTTPELLQTVAAIVTGTPTPSITLTTPSPVTTTPTLSFTTPSFNTTTSSFPVPPATGAAGYAQPSAIAAGVAALAGGFLVANL